jgi:hypothetical protein
LHPNIPARSYTNRIQLLFPVEDDQENKTPPLRPSRGTSARSNVEKTHAFTQHLAKVFQPHLSENEPDKEDAT